MAGKNLKRTTGIAWSMEQSGAMICLQVKP